MPNLSKASTRVTLEINLGQIKRNFQEVCKLVAPSKVTAVVKANAYGLGVIEIAQICKEAGADSFGVADVDEALELKDMGLPIMILGSILPGEISSAVEHELILPINDFEGARQISAEAIKQNKKVQYQILVDSGMGRLGILLEKAHQEIKKIITLPNLECIGIYSHLPLADNIESDCTGKQIESFQSLIKDLEADGISFENIHTANSDGINNYPQAYKKPFNRVRLGLNIYGYSNQKQLDLQTVISFKAKLVLARKLPVGSFIGYGKTHCLEKDSLIGTIAAGYADGLPLALSNCGQVLIRGKKCPIIGRVSMDYTTVDLSAVPDAACGDEVIFIGSQGGETIPLQSWALLKDTHAYDILCAISPRAKCVYIK
ncbi:MAG: alanine racemase [Victivallales bacterium]|nr:alanine racemase [Victivallales bacterium]